MSPPPIWRPFLIHYRVTSCLRGSSSVGKQKIKTTWFIWTCSKRKVLEKMAIQLVQRRWKTRSTSNNFLRSVGVRARTRGHFSQTSCWSLSVGPKLNHSWCRTFACVFFSFLAVIVWWFFAAIFSVKRGAKMTHTQAACTHLIRFSGQF